MSLTAKKFLFHYHNRFEAPKWLIQTADKEIKNWIMKELDRILNTMSSLAEVGVYEEIFDVFI